MDVVFLDKDQTLGQFHFAPTGLYPGVSEFLDSQKAAGRKLYIATTASNEGRVHLRDISDRLDGYFGREEIDGSRRQWYVSSDGTLRRIQDDYQERRYFESEEAQRTFDEEAEKKSNMLRTLSSNESERIKQELSSMWNYWTERLHKETRAPFGYSTRYQNPYISQGWPIKDLFLARRLIAQENYQNNYQELRTAMVGDQGDMESMSSDPETLLLLFFIALVKEIGIQFL